MIIYKKEKRKKKKLIFLFVYMYLYNKIYIYIFNNGNYFEEIPNMHELYNFKGMLFILLILFISLLLILIS